VIVLAPFAALVLAMATVIAIQGSFSQFLGDVFGEKSDYVARLGGSIPPGARQLARIFDRGESASMVFLDTQCLAILACAALVIRPVRRTWAHERARWMLVAGGALVAVAAMYPGTGYQHVTETMPLLLTVAGLAVARWPRPAGSVRMAAATATVVVLAFGVVAVTATRIDRLPRALDGRSAPHFAGGVIARWPRAGEDLDALRATTGGRVFILRADASFYYLAGGLTNPTRYDYAVRSDLGGDGERGVIRELQRGGVQWICLWEQANHPRVRDLYPHDLDRYVRAHGTLEVTTPTCDLYRLRASARRRAA
jgi:hypothetical protein